MNQAKNIKEQKVYQILIVEPFSTLRRTICRKLVTISGVILTEAKNISEAINILEVNFFDLIITEWNLEGKSGLELIKDIKQNKKHQNTPILLLTSEATKETLITALEAGANGVLGKPINPEALQNKVLKLLH